MKKINKFFTILMILIAVLSCKKEQKVMYHCPMHPSITSDRPGPCPICGMDLVKDENPLDEHKNHSENKEISKEEHKNHPENKETPKDIEAKSSNTEIEKKILVSEEKQMELGIKTYIVEKKELNKSIFSSGVITNDPNIYEALQEYKESLKIGGGFSSGAKLKLEKLGLSNGFINEWSSSRKDPSELLTGGKNGKAHVTSVIYEQDIGFVKEGQKINLTASSYPGKNFTGSIKFIDKIIDEKTRTLNLRIEVLDKESILRPQMFVKVEINIGVGKGLVIPRSALIDTGERQVVYVKKVSNEFYPRAIKIGGEVGEFVEVLSGVSEKEEVVESGNFYLDSESSLRFGDTQSAPHKH